MGNQRRYFERDGKDFNFKALAEIRYAMVAEVDRLIESQPKIDTANRGKRKPGKIDVGNWIMAGYFALTPEARDRIIELGRKECEDRQESATPVPFNLAGVNSARASSPGPVNKIDHPRKDSGEADRRPRKRG